MSNCKDTKLQEISLFLMMYSDDKVLLSEFPESLQNIHDTLHEYCNDWKLSVNVCETKIVVFRKSGRLKQSCYWFIII